MTNGPEFLTIGEAAELLGVDRRRIRQLIQRGRLAATENPLDLREKLVSRSEVEALLRFARAGKKEVA